MHRWRTSQNQPESSLYFLLPRQHADWLYSFLFSQQEHTGNLAHPAQMCYTNEYLTALANEPVRINREIRAKELRVIGAAGENLGVISLAEALKAAEAAGQDLIEISPSAVPPVAKVMDYGKFEYERSKKESAARSKAKVSETKEVQIKVGTGDHDMMLKAKKAAEWLAEGHRVRAELFLKGRYKGMDEAFLKTRLEKFLLLIPYAYKVADPVVRSPKGFAGVIERDLMAQAKREKEKPIETSKPNTL